MSKTSATSDVSRSVEGQGGDDLRSLREERDRLALKSEIAELQSSRALIESTLTPYGTLIDPSEWIQDVGHAGGRLFIGQASLQDRVEGRNPPAFRTLEELEIIRAASRILADTDETAIAALENLTNYVIFNGFDYRAESSKRSEGDDQSLIDAVSDFVDEFLEDSDWVGDLDREIFKRSRRDGEVFVGLFDRGRGRIVPRIIEPEMIRQPDPAGGQIIDDDLGYGFETSWTFGVHTRADDVQTVLGYYVQWTENENDWDYLPASRVEHIKINVDGNIKRGLSDFFAIEKALRSSAKLIGNMTDGAAIQAAIALIREHAPGVPKDSIQDFAANQATRTSTETTFNGQRTVYEKQWHSGTEIDIPSGRTYHPGPMGSSNAPVYVEVLQAALRSIGKRWSMPEYMISGDASNANYSSSLVAESPFVKAAESWQYFYAKRFRRLLWKAVDMAAEAGRFNRFNMSVRSMKRLVELEIEPPQVSVRDTEKDTNRRAILADRGLLSDPTFASQEGLDFEQEQANGAKKTAPMGPSPVGSAALRGALESVETKDEARKILESAARDPYGWL